MLVSHESPICLLDVSRQYNDYDYALVHLFEQYPEYYSFFKSSLLQGREVLLDNSIFELGVSFDADKYADYITELQPTFYIVPDVLEDGVKTVQSYINFYKSYPTLPGLRIGVVQGKTYDELVYCYEYMKNNADYIAISFDYSWYQTIGRSTVAKTNINHAHIQKLERYCSGRQKLISSLMHDKIWDNTKPHHLLGCSLAREFTAYRGISSIRSCDTSNPVVAGMVGARYIKGVGLYSKPTIKLADKINANISADRLEDILYNVNEFKYLI